MGRFNDATIFADYWIPRFKADKQRNDSAYAEFLFYFSIAYGYQRKFNETESTITELENVVLKRFGSQDIKYYTALYLHYLKYHRQVDFEKQIFYLMQCKKILSNILVNYKTKLVSFEANYDKEDIKYLLSNILHSLGSSYAHTNKFSEAKNYFNEARIYDDDEYTIKNDPQSHLVFMNNYGSFILILLEEIEEAEQIYLDLEAWGKKAFNETHPLFGNIQYYLGEFYSTIGDYSTAEKKFLLAKKIFDNNFQKNTLTYYDLIQNIAGIYVDLNDTDKIKPAIEAVKKTIAKLDTTHIAEYTHALCLLAQYYINNKEIKMADSTLFPLDTFYRNKNFSFTYVFDDYLRNRATIYTLNKQFQKADSIYSFILSGSEPAKNTLTGIHAGYLLKKSINYFAWNKIDSARKYIIESTSTITQILKKYFSFLSENQKQNYLNLSLNHYNNLFKLVTSLPNDKALSTLAYNYQLLLKGLLLKTSVITNRNNDETDTVYNKFYKQYLEVRKAIAIESLKPPEERYKFDELQQTAEVLEKKLTKLSPRFIAQQFNPLTTSDVTGQLKNNEAAIEFFYFQSKDSTYYGALLLKSGQVAPTVVSLFEKSQLDMVLAKTKGLKKEATINLRYAKSSSLYELIWQPLEKNLTGINKIYFAPSGILLKIPFAALAVNANERVSDKYRMIQLNTTASITNPSTEYISNSDHIYLYGGVFYDGDTNALRQAAIQYKEKDLVSRSLPDDPDRGNVYQYLPGTKTEVENIDSIARQKKINTHLFTGWDATEESVKSLDGKNVSGVLHFATHGYFFTDPKIKPDKSVASEGRVFRQSENPLVRSGLAMAGANFAWSGKPISNIEDGILTAYEVSNLYLPNFKLVVMSACETGLGDIQGSEGVYGLQRAFKMSAIKNLVMSLWDVPDEETAEFMTEFYKEMFAGQTIENAFYNTQTNMKNKYRNEPYKWAAWILVK
jgi:CHAT domain-containing protein